MQNQFKIRDLIDIDEFQSLLDQFSEITNATFSIIDEDGQSITNEKHHTFCELFHKENIEFQMQCKKFHTKMINNIHNGEDSITFKCPNGLYENTFPIVIDNKYYGGFFTGQFFMNPPDLEYFKAQAKTLNYDESVYLKAVNEIPVWNKDKLNKYIGYIKALINILFLNGLKRLEEKHSFLYQLKTQEKYQTLLKNSIDGFYILDKDGNIIEVNDSYCHMSGYSRDELLKLNLKDIIGIDQEQFELNFESSKINEKVIIESYHKRKNGEIYLVELSIYYNNTTENEYFAVFIRDITERKLLEDTLVFLSQKGWKDSNENFFYALAKFIADKFQMDYVCIDTLEPSLLEATTLSIYFDGHFEDNVKYTLKETPCGEVVGKHICKFEKGVRHLFPNDAILQDMLAESYIGTTLFDSKDNPIGLIAVIGRKPMKYPEIYENLLKIIAVRASGEIEAIKYQEKLIESEQKFKDAFYYSPDSININKLDGTYLEVNQGFLDITGYSIDEVIGKTSFELNIWDNIEDRNRLVKELKEKGEIFNLEAQFRRKDGTKIPGLMSARLIKINGEPHIISITRNIQEIKDYHEQILNALKFAEESDKLKTAFLQNMSHEIRTPLNSIVGFSSLLKSPSNLCEADISHFSEIIYDSAMQLLSIVNDVLDISSIDTNLVKPTIEDFALNEICRHFGSFYKEIISKKSINFIIRSSLKDDYIVTTDKLKLFKIISNILDNSIKFTNQGYIKLNVTELEKCIQISIEDSGIGIKEEYLDKIWEKFWQYEAYSTQKYGGTGLGLPIVKGLCNLLGINVYCKSKFGEGTAFFIDIPKKIVKQAKIEKPDFQPNINNKEMIKALVAEDNDSNYKYISELLKKRKYDYIRAINGEEAVELALNNCFDIIFMDLKMPIIDGFEAIRQILCQKPEQIIVAVSAFAHSNDVELALKNGAKAYLKKPYIVDEFYSIIDKLLFEK